MDALDKEREELQNQLGESEEQQSKLQHQLKRVTEEKKQLLDQSVPQQVLLGTTTISVYKQGWQTINTMNTTSSAAKDGNHF